MVVTSFYTYSFYRPLLLQLTCGIIFPEAFELVTEIRISVFFSRSVMYKSVSVKRNRS